jgi:hypothetical protein
MTIRSLFIILLAALTMPMSAKPTKSSLGVDKTGKNGAPLPYDAIVEYIRVPRLQDDSGNWYIEDAWAVVPCEITGTEAVSVVYGLDSAAYNQMAAVYGMTRPNTSLVGFGVTHNRNSNTLSRQQIFVLSGGSTSGNFGGWKSGAQTGVRLSSTIDLSDNCYYDQASTKFVFNPAASVSGVSYIGLFCSISADGDAAIRKSAGYIYSFAVVREGKTLVDLIPVRKGSEGCFYDRVSGTIIRNQGTGAFVVGPDKN